LDLRGWNGQIEERAGKTSRQSKRLPHSTRESPGASAAQDDERRLRSSEKVVKRCKPEPSRRSDRAGTALKRPSNRTGWVDLIFATIETSGNRGGDADAEIEYRELELFARSEIVTARDDADVGMRVRQRVDEDLSDRIDDILRRQAAEHASPTGPLVVEIRPDGRGGVGAERPERDRRLAPNAGPSKPTIRENGWA